jgi:peptidyl-prolyl cis-trans isomerase SurA
MKRKKLFLIIFGLFLLLHRWSLNSQAVVDRVVAVVNEEIITLSEVEKRSHPLQEEIQTTDRLERRKRIHEIFRKVLDRLVEEKLIDQEAKKSGIKVSSKEVEAAVEEIRRKNAVNQEQFEQLLAAEGLTPEAFKQEIEKRLLRTKLVNWAVKIEYKVGERELRDFYQRNADRYRINESYRPSHILFVIPKEATARQIQEIRKRCQEVLERIKKGEDFGELARLYSEDHSSAKDRGDLGYFKKGELLPALEKEAANLKIGEVSGIIRTDFGFHILKLLDRKGGEPAPFEEIRERLQADYYEEEMERALQQFLTKLKEKAIIEIKL